MSATYYRPEIDGLRALAIIPVVLFHAGFSVFSGGFVGVDIFFVISGFLITSIILRELENKSFSLLNFYERRVRRILPALSVVILTTLIFFSFKMIPSDLEAVGYSALSAILFFANMYFMGQEGYFEAPADTKPLLHTWSLAVEEQFYIILPLILMSIYALYRGRKINLISGLFFVLFIASLSLSIWLAFLPQDSSPKTWLMPLSIWGNATISSTNFYLFFTRAWELLIGSLLAVFSSQIRPNNTIKEFMSLSGIALIIFSIFFIKEGWVFPAYWALLPTIGTALVIAGNDGQNLTKSAQLLSTKPLIWIGKISYSLYLWHWPVFTYAHYTSSEPLNAQEKIGLVALSVLLATLSYYFIEQPVRRKQILAAQKHVFTGALFVFAVLITASFGAVYYAKERQKTADIIQQAFNKSQIPHDRQDECFERTPEQLRKIGPCLAGDKSGDKLTLLLWGDSHADVLTPLIDKIAEDHNIKAAIYAHGKCPPILDAYYQKGNQCEKAKRFIKTFIEKEKPTHILLVSRWAANIAGPRHKKQTDIADLLKDNKLSSKTPDDAYIVFERNFS